VRGRQQIIERNYMKRLLKELQHQQSLLGDQRKSAEHLELSKKSRGSHGKLGKFEDPEGGGPGPERKYG